MLLRFAPGLVSIGIALSVALTVALPTQVLAQPTGADADAQPLTALPYSPSLDLRSLDRSAEPCVDFYRFACGGWIQSNPIPPDQASWNIYAKLQQDNQRFLWGLLIDAAVERPGRSAVQQKTGDYFAACMNQPAIDAAGAAPLQRVLADVDALGSLRDAARLLARMHLSGVDGALFRFGSEQDFADSSRVIATVDAGGLGLPDRDYYVKTDAKSVALRSAYRAHVALMFVLAGEPASIADAAAAGVVALETALARASLTREARRDPRKVYHRMRLAQLRSLAPAFDWPAYVGASRLPRVTPINVTQPAFVRQIDALLRHRPLAQWKTYLRWHVLREQAPYLATPFMQADFDFYSATLHGVERMPPRWKQCVRWVDRDLGEALGQVFVQRTFAPQTKQRVAEMTRRIEAAMASRIEALDWMSAATKQAALAKLRSMVDKIGYPERWRDYSALDIRRDDFFGNVQRSAAFETRRQLDKIGKPVDRSEWGMTPPTVNAYYDPQMNDINFPAGILQPPLFDPQLDDAPNYGNTGATIGHELTHGFDDVGRQFDAHGNLRDWWSANDAAAFRQRAECVARQYSGYTIIDDIKINGHLTLGEDVADLGGTVLAYVAWKAATAGQPLGERDGFTPEQRFFVGAAQWACGDRRSEDQRVRAVTDMHSPPRYRINGVFANMPEFARAFACRRGQPMVRDTPCKVW